MLDILRNTVGSGLCTVGRGLRTVDRVVDELSSCDEVAVLSWGSVDGQLTRKYGQCLVHSC